MFKKKIVSVITYVIAAIDSCPVNGLSLFFFKSISLKVIKKKVMQLAVLARMSSVLEIFLCQKLTYLPLWRTDTGDSFNGLYVKKGP